MYCPKCGNKYECACDSCKKTKNWEMFAKTIKCKKCKLQMSHDWWFQLECDIYRKEIRAHSKNP